MNRRTFVSDTISLALIYSHQVNESNIILLSKAYEYDRVINEILDEKNIEFPNLYYLFYQQPNLFFSAFDGENYYAVLNPSVKIVEERKKILDAIPTKYLETSQDNRALEVIGLELANGVLREKSEITKTLK